MKPAKLSAKLCVTLRFFQGSRVCCFGQSEQGPGLKNFKNHSVKGGGWGGEGEERLKVNEINYKLKGNQIFNSLKIILGPGSQWNHVRSQF